MIHVMRVVRVVKVERVDDKCGEGGEGDDHTNTDRLRPGLCCCCRDKVGAKSRRYPGKADLGDRQSPLQVAAPEHASLRPRRGTGGVAGMACKATCSNAGACSSGRG